MIPYIDMHCDTLMQAYMNKKSDIYELPECMLDVKRLHDVGMMAQFFAVFMLPESMREKLGEAYPEDGAYIEALAAIYHKTLENNTTVIAGTKTYDELEQHERHGKISAVLTLEDGRVVDGRMENLKWLYDRGIRLITLTWNYENCFGFPNSRDVQMMRTGLKPFGKEAVEVMNDLGMLVDVSHLSDEGFWDVVKLSKKPFAASHSNCRAIAPHPRNLTDEMIRALADKGGVMGLNFYGPFLNEDGAGMESRIAQMMKHMKHMIKVGGNDIAAIGTDFDGIEGMLDIADCSRMQLLFDAMEREGFTTEQMEKIAYKNVKRVIKEVL